MVLVGGRGRGVGGDRDGLPHRNNFTYRKRSIHLQRAGLRNAKLALKEKEQRTDGGRYASTGSSPKNKF